MAASFPSQLESTYPALIPHHKRCLHLYHSSVRMTFENSYILQNPSNIPIRNPETSSHTHPCWRFPLDYNPADSGLLLADIL